MAMNRGSFTLTLLLWMALLTGFGSNSMVIEPRNQSTPTMRTTNGTSSGPASSRDSMRLDLQGEINQILSTLYSGCRTAIVQEERQCYVKYLDRYDQLANQFVTEDSSSEFDRKLCCSLWDWADCTRDSISTHCQPSNVDQFQLQLSQSALQRQYCRGYEYGSYYCWPLPLWAYLVIGTVAVTICAVGTVGIIWYWRRGASLNIDYHRKRRRRQTFT